MISMSVPQTPTRRPCTSMAPSSGDGSGRSLTPAVSGLPGTTDKALTLTLPPRSTSSPQGSVVRVSTPVHLSAGDPAPDFTLPDADGRPVSLRDFRGRRVIVYFYPAAMTAGCTTQACDFRDNLSEFDGAGVTVLGISPDP